MSYASFYPFHTQTVLQCKALRFAYPGAPEYCFTWSMKRGETAVLIGKSGAGKSTFLSLIAGFLTPTSGELWIDGEKAHAKQPHERNLSILFQSHNLFPHLTAYQNVALGLSPSMRLSYAQTQEIDHLFEELEVQSCAKRPVSTLSGGECQRIAIIRCLVRRKSLWLLDEPFAALDPPLRIRGHELIHKKAKAHNFSVLIVTHYPREIEPFTDTWVHLEKGSLQPLPHYEKIPH